MQYVMYNTKPETKLLGLSILLYYFNCSSCFIETSFTKHNYDSQVHCQVLKLKGND